jgi:hypothetical protein
VQAYADTSGWVAVIKPLVPTERAIEPGTMGLGMLRDPLRGRSPLSRLAACFAPPETALLVGQAVAPETCDEDPVGRVVARLYDPGTRQVCTACAVRADQVFGCDKRSVPFATTAMPVYGDAVLPEKTAAQQVPLTIPHG